MCDHVLGISTLPQTCYQKFIVHLKYTVTLQKTLWREFPYQRWVFCALLKLVSMKLLMYVAEALLQQWFLMF